MEPSNQRSQARNAIDVGIELAKERNRLAAERTLMAWIRTSLAMIGFGFGIDSVVSAILSFQTVSEDVNSARLSRFLGLAFIALGVYALLAAIVDHTRELRRIRGNAQYTYKPRLSVGMTVSIGLLIIGVLAFASIFIQAILRSLA